MINWIRYNGDALIIGIITGLIVAMVLHLCNVLRLIIKNRESDLTGEWVQNIYAVNDKKYQGEIVKSDTYKLKHMRIFETDEISININGTIERTFPQNQNDKRWTFIGCYSGNVLTILFQSKEGQRSRGCIYAKLIGSYEFRGFYLEEHKDGTIDKVPLIIKKRV